MIQHYVWVFDCPVCGNQSSVLCHRAFDPELEGRWHKYLVTYQPVIVTDEEREAHFAHITKEHNEDLRQARAYLNG